LKIRVINRSMRKLNVAKAPEQKTLSAKIRALLKAGADGLANQHQHSLGYCLGGSDSIAEANIVLHLGFVALQRKYATWLESPFGAARGRPKRLDMYIDMTPKDERQTLLLIEAKRLLWKDRNKKSEEVVADCERLNDWLQVPRRPIFHSLIGAQSVSIAMAIICPDEPAKAAGGQPGFL
jgi:hypothetical protein